jgi:hypothetical protein
MVKMAVEFDVMSEKVIDANMCTGHCPCYVAPPGTDGDETHAATARFKSVNEAYLNLRNRTWDFDTRGNTTHIPFVWTNNATTGVTTFEECLNLHFKEGMS